MSRVSLETGSRRSDFYAGKQYFSRAFLGVDRSRPKRKTSDRYAPVANVVAVGIGPKKVNGGATSVPSITFLVRKKAPKSKVGKRAMIPKYWEGLATDVEEVRGAFFLSGRTAVPQLQGAVQPGCSIGYMCPSQSLVRNAGTLGALVKDAQGVFYFLSNYHVLAGLSAPNSPCMVTCPGSLDSDVPRTIGQFVRGVCPTVNNINRIDAALAGIRAGISFSPDILEVGVISGLKLARQTMIVEKYGRTTGFRQGLVTHIYYDLCVPTPFGEAKFVDQIAIQALYGNSFAEEGDSGALILESRTNCAVGLLFATAGAYCFANPISPVLSQMGVELVMGS